MCSTNLGFSAGSANRYCCRTLRQYDTRYVLCTRYVCTWYQLAEIYTCVRTFRPWTHTSDNSYIYQLSLVVATAIVSFYFIVQRAIYRRGFGFETELRDGKKEEAKAGGAVPTVYHTANATAAPVMKLQHGNEKQGTGS